MDTVHIELKRVQTWLFEVPRLRAMRGANALLGRVLRHSLRTLAKSETAWKLFPAPDASSFPTADPQDPLQARDDPQADAKEGIISRDGGHFEAYFSSGAQEFAAAATKLLERDVPGLQYRVSINGESTPGAVTTMLPNDLPVLAPCSWTGGGLASTAIRPAGGEEVVPVSLEVMRRLDEAELLKDGRQHHDLATHLIAETALHGLTSPQDFDELAQSGYLALIHADGNGVGSHGHTGAARAARAAFFHRNRVLMRKALRHALNAVAERASGQAPLIPLMLGGDDILVVCSAEHAFDFTVELCKELDALQRDNSNGFRLTLGVGIVIARSKIPIHRLHEVASQLTDSAKRMYRQRYKPGGANVGRSVVDWAVYSASSLGNPIDDRRRDWVRTGKDYTCIVSERPVNVLTNTGSSLEGLLKNAKAINRAPRSQLRYLQNELFKGRTLAELAFEELSSDTRKAFAGAGVKSVWTSVGNGSQQQYTTKLYDIIEILEILRKAGTASDIVDNARSEQ